MSTIAVLSADTVYRQPMQGGLCKKAANKGHTAFLEGENRGGIHVFDAFWRAGCYFLRHPTTQGGSRRGLPPRPGRLRVLLPSPPEPWAGFCRAANRQYKGMPPPAFFGTGQSTGFVSLGCPVQPMLRVGLELGVFTFVDTGMKSFFQAFCFGVHAL